MIKPRNIKKSLSLLVDKLCLFFWHHVYCILCYLDVFMRAKNALGSTSTACGFVSWLPFPCSYILMIINKFYKFNCLCRVVWPRDLCYVRYWRRNDDGSYGMYIVSFYIPNPVASFSNTSGCMSSSCSCVVSIQGAPKLWSTARIRESSY